MNIFSKKTEEEKKALIELEETNSSIKIILSNIDKGQKILIDDSVVCVFDSYKQEDLYFNAIYKGEKTLIEIHRFIALVDNSKKCPFCDGNLHEKGYMKSPDDYGVFYSIEVKNKFDKNNKLKIPKFGRKISVYRCLKCGYLSMFANNDV